MIEVSIKTSSKESLVDITDLVAKALADSKATFGTVTVFIPHTTAGIMVNEGTDKSVTGDFLWALEKMVPDGPYNHGEGNSVAHIKTILTGNSAVIPIEHGKMALGTWQRIFLCEFDGPKTRKVRVMIVGSIA